jgi:hypothetical protein
LSLRPMHQIIGLRRAISAYDEVNGPIAEQD